MPKVLGAAWVPKSPSKPAHSTGDTAETEHPDFKGWAAAATWSEKKVEAASLTTRRQPQVFEASVSVVTGGALEGSACLKSRQSLSERTWGWDFPTKYAKIKYLEVRIALSRVGLETL